MTLFRKNYEERTDEELMSLLVKSEQSAFDELYRRYSKPLLNFFYRMLNYEREKAEDFLQDLFLKIIEKPENFDKSQRFSTWFYTLATNMVKNEYRSLQIRSEYQQFLEIRQTETTEFNDESIDNQQFGCRLQIEIDKLDAETKTLFNLRFVEEMNLKEIAETMKCPEGTIKSRLFYLSKHLSKKLSIFKPE
jgi:RNA polymerase sigma-70 factor (ECF subfamily)